MSRLKTGLSLGVLVALVIAIWAALASGGSDPDPTTTTTTVAPSTTTAVLATTTSTTVPPETSIPETTVDGEARLEEVRLILEDLYFRWFDAIYNNDEEAVRQVIATQAYLEAFRAAVENLELPRAPERTDIVVEEIEILHDTATCLVTFSTLNLTNWRGAGATTSGVNVLLKDDDRWLLGTAWTNRGDLWEADCDIEPELSR